jgi:hypothetical protein
VIDTLPRFIGPHPLPRFWKPRVQWRSYWRLLGADAIAVDADNAASFHTVPSFWALMNNESFIVKLTQSPVFLLGRASLPERNLSMFHPDEALAHQ